MCCLVRAVDDYGAMAVAVSGGNVMIFCLVRAVDDYGAMAEWRLAGGM
jgi:hypothetical protein